MPLTLLFAALAVSGFALVAGSFVLLRSSGASPTVARRLAGPPEVKVGRLLDDAVLITPGLESPTVSPLADPDWVAVRAMVPRTEQNALMDRLAELGAKAILAFDIRSCRAF